MKAFETAKSELHPDAATGGSPDAGDVTTWLLEGRFLTIDPAANVTSWSPLAAEVFGWRRQDIVGGPFVDALLAPHARPDQAGQLAELLAGRVEGVQYSGGVDAVDASERQLPAEFAAVPIKLGMGYAFNALLQEIAARSTDADALAEMKTRYEEVLAMIAGALAGQPDEPAEGDRIAGALVVFRAGAAAAAPPPPVVDNVVSISDAPGSEEARAQVERARRDAEQGRVEVRNLTGQLDEARREAQRARNEADVARQEANDSRDALIVAQRGADEARRHLEDARRSADEVRTGAEAARIRSEEAQREADSLREQLRDARESVRGMAGRADDELAQAQEREARAARELADARAEVARHEAEVAPLRERYQAAQRELGALRADLESALADAAERETLGERRAGELERARHELESRAAELAAAREEAEARAAEIAALRSELDEARGTVASAGTARDAPDHELHALRERLGRMRAAFDRAPVGGALIAPDGRFVEVSDTLCETLGYSRDSLLSGEPPAVVHPDDVGAHRDLARRMLAGEQAVSRGYRRYVHADGHPLTVRENVALLRDADGRPSMFVVQLEEAHDHYAGGSGVADDEPAGYEAVPADRDRVEGPTGEAMRRALEDELFELHCQPVLDLRTNTIAQYELLIRMRGEDGRLVLPEAFLGPARRAGLAHAIDRWVVRRAIRLLHENEEVSLEVNLSPEAVHDPDLAAMVEEELAGTPIDPGRLVLEVSGDTAGDHLEETRELAKRLRGLGCRFALDDFRSSFGSFRLLRDLPLDYLKLDGELVGSLAESRTSQLIVKALVDVAAGTGMKTVAVFVSDEETVALLRQLGVAYAQGYTVGRPRPVGEVLRTDEARQLPPG